MSSASRNYGRFDELAEEFARRYRLGERPSLEEFVDRLPEMADEIREMFPTLVAVEQAEGDARADASLSPPAAAPRHSQIGDYRILREIGRGGMGVVYEAEQISLGRRVALKVLPSHAVDDRKTLERFRREAKAAARLHHTNIVPVFEVGRDRDVSFYAMQLIQGQGLEQVIDELARLRHPDRKSGSHARTAADVQSARLSAILAPAPGSASSRKRELSRVAESLLSGRLLSDGLESSDDDFAASIALDATEQFNPDAISGRSPASAIGDHPMAARAADAASSAVLPGGTHVSEVDSSVRRQPFFRSVAQIGRQAAQGLAYAHARGIVHRDIKPSNLLLDTAGVVWITDFGLAKAEDDGLTVTGDILGTLRYMAPERFRGEGDARADIYALGLTLYELLTLRPAYNSSDRLKLMEQVKGEEPARPRSIDSRVPRDLETIVLKAIEKEPGARYQSAEAMSEDLRRFLADEPIRARQISTSERYWRWARRNPWIATLGGVLTAVLVVATVGSLAAASRYEMIARSEKFANAQSQLDRTAAVKARREAIQERDKSRALSAGLALDRGFALAEAGQADRGLLWMLEALKTAPDDAVAFRKMVRWNLGAWLGQVHKALKFIDIGGRCDSIGFSPDGRTFAAGFGALDPSIERPIDLWDAASARKLFTLPGAFGPFAFRPDGRVLIATGENQRGIAAIDLGARRELWTTPQLLGDSGGRIEFSPDGSRVFACRFEKSGSGWLLQLDAVTGRQCGEPIRGWGGIAVSPDGGSVAAGRSENGEAFVDLHDLPSGRRGASWRAGRQGLLLFVFSPNGKALYGSVVEGDAFKGRSYSGQIWSADTGKSSSPRMAHTGAAVFNASGDRLVTSTDNRLFVRDADGRVLGSGFPLEGGGAQTLIPSAAHPDGRIMLAAASDNSARLWEISPDAEPVPGGVTDARGSTTRSVSERQTRGFSVFWAGLRADGRIAVSLAHDAAGRERLQFADPATGRPSGRPAAHHPGWVIRALAFSPDGRRFATGSNPHDRVTGELNLWDASTGRLLFPPAPHTNYVSAIAFHPDGKLVAAGDYHGLVRTWDSSTGREFGRPLPQREIVMSLAYSTDGKMLAVGLSNDHTRKPGTRLWDAGTRQPIGELLPAPEAVTRIEFRPDGRALLADSQGSTRLWDTVRGQALGEPIIDEAAAGFRSDGRVFLTVGRDGAVKLRDATTAKVVARFPTSSSPAVCAAFRGDGGLIAAGFEDGAVRVYDPATNQPVGPPRCMRHAVHQVAFMSDRQSVAAIDEFGESRTWPIPEPLAAGSNDDLTLRVEARTGLRMDSGLAISRLDGPAWRERIEQLGQLDPVAVRPDDDPAWHEPMIREAEQNGHAFAAIWHLDRLIAARPDDWYLYARRARALSRSDEFKKAAVDYEQAERLGKREVVLDVQVHCVLDCAKAERWGEALWYLDRLLAARPDDATLREDRAGVYGKLGRESERQAELARAFELGADEELVIPRAVELGRAGRWVQASRLLARCGRKGAVGRELAQAWGVACMKGGDRVGYREACTAFMAWEGPEPTVLWNALSQASLLALAPEAIDDYRAPVAWFEKRLTANPAPASLVRRLFSNALGGLLLRAGRFDEAIARLNESMAVAKEIELPTEWAYLAMAHARKGNFAQARRWLDRLRALQADPQGSFWDVQELAVLQSEAESLFSDAVFPSDPFQRPRRR
jgi:eukaryotic-like serine/threonine-protein kinase